VAVAGQLQLFLLYALGDISVAVTSEDQRRWDVTMHTFSAADKDNVVFVSETDITNHEFLVCVFYKCEERKLKAQYSLSPVPPQMYMHAISRPDCYDDDTHAGCVYCLSRPFVTSQQYKPATPLPLL
jgi:hypothetical protein